MVVPISAYVNIFVSCFIASVRGEEAFENLVSNVSYNDQCLNTKPWVRIEIR